MILDAYTALAIFCYLRYSMAMSKRKKRKSIRRALQSQQCYLCGKYGDTEEEDIMTQDHVPPHGLSPLSPDSDFLLLPAHMTCNNHYSVQERRVITFLASACGYKGNDSADTAWKAAERSFKLNEIGRAGGPSKDLMRLLKNSKPVDMYTPQGLFRGQRIICWPSDDTDVKLIIGKIVRGLHYHHAHTFVPGTWEVSVFLQPAKPEHLPLFESFPIFRRMGDFLTYRGVCSKNRSIWYLRLYHEAYAVAIIDNLAVFDGPEDVVELGDKAAPYLELTPGP